VCVCVCARARACARACACDAFLLGGGGFLHKTSYRGERGAGVDALLAELVEQRVNDRLAEAELLDPRLHASVPLDDQL
jgi:hypothetical protein